MLKFYFVLLEFLLLTKQVFPFHVFKGWSDFSLKGHKVCFTEKEKKKDFKVNFLDSGKFLHVLVKSFYGQKIVLYME